MAPRRRSSRNKRQRKETEQDQNGYITLVALRNLTMKFIAVAAISAFTFFLLKETGVIKTRSTPQKKITDSGSNEETEKPETIPPKQSQSFFARLSPIVNVLIWLFVLGIVIFVLRKVQHHPYSYNFLKHELGWAASGYTENYKLQEILGNLNDHWASLDVTQRGRIWWLTHQLVYYHTQQAHADNLKNGIEQLLEDAKSPEDVEYYWKQLKEVEKNIDIYRRTAEGITGKISKITKGMENIMATEDTPRSIVEETTSSARNYAGKWWNSFKKFFDLYDLNEDDAK